MSTAPPITRNDLDQRIWDEELDDFVPRDVFDAVGERSPSARR